MSKFDYLKRLLANPGLEKAEQEGLEDIARMSPRSVTNELSEANPSLARKADIEQALNESNPNASSMTAQELDSQLGINNTPKSAQDSANILSPGSDIQASVNPEAPKSSFNLDDLMEKMKSLPKDHPLLTGAAGLGAYGMYKASKSQPQPPAPVRQPAASPSDDDQDEEEEDKPAAKSGGGKPTRSSNPSLDLSQVTNPSGPSLAGLMSNLTENRDRQTLTAQLGKAGDVIGSSISHTTPKSGAAFDEIGKEGEKPLQDLVAQQEMQKYDPNSTISKAYRDFSKQIGVKVADNASAYDLQKLEPLMTNYMKTKEAAQARKDAKDAMAEAKNSDKLDKRFSDLNKGLTSEIASSRSAFGKGANVYRSAEAIQRLAENMDPNNLDLRQIKEVARNLDAMLASGQSTVSGARGLIPESVSGDVSKMVEYIAGIPKGAQQGAFVKKMLDTVSREKELAAEQIKRTQRKMLAGYEDLRQKDPDRFNRLLEVHDLPADIFAEDALKKKEKSFDDLGFKPSN